MRAILLGPIWKKSYAAPAFKASLKINEEKDLFIGIDGGTVHWQKWKLQPHLAVGDWDSLKKIKTTLAHVKFITLPENKARSDLFYSIIAAIGAGAKELLCVGVTGGRPDHHQAMLYDLAEFAAGSYGPVERVTAMGSEGEYHFLSGGAQWKSPERFREGQTISVFSTGEIATGVTLKGFQYPLKDQKLPPSSQGLSNQLKNKRGEIHLRKGKLLIIIPSDEWS